MTTPVLWDYEKLILFVKPFCAFFKQCTAIGFFLISYKHTVQILQTISSVISSLYRWFIAYAVPVKAFSHLFWFLRKAFQLRKKTHVCTGGLPEPFYAKPGLLFLKNKYYIFAQQNVRKGVCYEKEISGNGGTVVRFLFYRFCPESIQF